MDILTLENIIHHLNCKWKLQTLYYWIGVSPLFNPADMYEGYDRFLNVYAIKSTNEIKAHKQRICIKHGLIDHYMQKLLMPYEAEMRTWMLGAAAYVHGKKIYIKEIIPYCQKLSTYEDRQILQKEVSALCKFLKPFVLNYWDMLLDILINELGFDSYIDYCQQKKGLDYSYFYKLLKRILKLTDDIYYPKMQEWTIKKFGLSLESLTRFDAINLLSLGEFDYIFPHNGLALFMEFLKSWDIDVAKVPGLYLDISYNQKKSAQAMSFIIQIPEEIYIVIRPVGGWIDIETLAHEIGHGLSAAYTNPQLPLIDRDLSTSYILSESFAFLLQNISISYPFLKHILNISDYDANILYYYKVLKDISIFRRYATKFIVEYEMFSKDNISDGTIYSDYMSSYTGFYYQPESHLFDLVPEFYSLDYIIAWIIEAIMERYLRKGFGDKWIFKREAVDVIKRWWYQGNKYDIYKFLDINQIGEFSIKPLLERWEMVLDANRHNI